MCKINSSEQKYCHTKCNALKFCEHEFNSALLANFVSTTQYMYIMYAQITYHARAGKQNTHAQSWRRSGLINNYELCDVGGASN